MHIRTHLCPQAKGKTCLGVYPDGMVEHDAHVGQIQNTLDELGIADNTIMYSTDPFERAQHEGMGYKRYWIERGFLLVPAQAFVAR